MRSDYNILWLDDDFENDTAFLTNLLLKTENYLKEKGYNPNIIKVSNKDDALEMVSSNKKIDLFLSDYNISTDDEFSGFDFLLATRTKYKQEMLLYSNQNDQQLKGHIIDYLTKDSTPLEYFSKFIFKSATNRILLFDSIKSLIDLTLIRWNELNALRGLYLSETSQIHYDSKKYIQEKVPDTQLVSDFSNNYSSSRRMQSKKQQIIDILNGSAAYNEKLFDFYEVQCVLSNSTNNLYTIWEKIRSIRNGCAHVKQFVDDDGECFITLMDNTTKINESEICLYRSKLLNFVAEYYNNYPPDDETNIEEPELVESAS
ncbi:MAG: hypothetical protein PHE54_02945 [Bacilli bacterium]|nr:hypothetical protein [Bacilli bacterium]